jgi:hypothetical protein
MVGNKVNRKEATMATKKKAAKKARKLVLVRTYSAGVHFGELVARKGKELTLANTCRIWRWRGANTLSEIALRGIEPASGGHSRVSECVAENTLTEAIEVLSVTDAAAASIRSCGWAE